MSLKDNLPKFIAEEKYTKEILDAIETEIDKIKLKINKTLLECCVSTCTIDGIRLFEKDYAIKYNPNLSLEYRKKQVINKMLAKKRLNKSELINFIKRNINGTQFYIMNQAEKYSFKIYLLNEEYAERLYDSIFKIKPAYLVFKIEMTECKRRCGTFNCNELII